MKKLFISCPMKGRTEENIRKSMERLHKLAEIVFDEKLEVIQSYIEDNPPENSNQSVWYLGKSIQLLSQADYFIGIQQSDVFKGCNIELEVARSYGIKYFTIPSIEFMADTIEVERKFWNENAYPVNP